MPGYRVHLMGGFSAAMIVMICLRSLMPTPLTMVEWLGFALAGSLFPDIDTKSKGQLWFYRVFAVVLAICLVNGHFLIAACASMICVTPLLVRHRGLFHRPWFVIAMPCVIVTGIGSYAPAYTRIFSYDALFFITGALSHIWLDIGIFRSFKR